MAKQPDVIEIARTVDGQTEAVSHLRYAQGALTLCGRTAPGRYAHPDERTWYPVGQDEADRFESCERCAERAPSFHVVSRPLVSERPVPAAPILSARVDGVAGLYGAACRGISEYMTGRSVVTEMTLRHILRLVVEIDTATIGDGLNGNMSAQLAGQRMQTIGGNAKQIMSLVRLYLPQEAPTAPGSSETAPNTQTP